MKFFEACEDILKNPHVQYQRKNGIDVLKNIDGEIYTFNSEGDWIKAPISEFNFKSEWEKLIKEVSFTEAVKALDNGKEIYCLCYNGFAEVKSCYEPDHDFFFRDKHAFPVSTKEILHGKWYVKE